MLLKPTWIISGTLLTTPLLFLLPHLSKLRACNQACNLKKEVILTQVLEKAIVSIIDVLEPWAHASTSLGSKCSDIFTP